jgi:hypothetical protein
MSQLIENKGRRLILTARKYVTLGPKNHGAQTKYLYQKDLDK